MNEIILIKNGELALKGLNRMTFEDILVKNIRRRISAFGNISVRKAQSTIYIEPKDEDYPFDPVLDAMRQVFGIAAFTRALAVEKDMDVILKAAPKYLENRLKNAKTFKVESKRSDKRFPLTSPEISRELGGALLAAYPHLKVDVHHPDEVIMVEIRDYAAYIHGEQIKGAGGMPVGSGGRAAVLISGGIDSPVAAYMMSKRCSLCLAALYKSARRAESKALAAKGIGLQRHDTARHCTVYRNSGKDRRMLPRRIFHADYAAVYDEDCRTNCQRTRLRRADHR